MCCRSLRFAFDKTASDKIAKCSSSIRTFLKNHSPHMGMFFVFIYCYFRTLECMRNVCLRIYIKMSYTLLCLFRPFMICWRRSLDLEQDRYKSCQLLTISCSRQDGWAGVFTRLRSSRQRARWSSALAYLRALQGAFWVIANCCSWPHLHVRDHYLCRLRFRIVLSEYPITNVHVPSEDEGGWLTST